MKTVVRGQKTNKPAIKPAKKAVEYTAEVGEFNGRPVFRVVHEEEQEFPDFGFGLGKARKLVAVEGWAEKLQAFVDSEGDNLGE
jgi:hypothetical protein